MNENLTDDLVLRFVAAKFKLKGMRVVSVGTSPSEAGEDIIIRLEGMPQNAPETTQNGQQGE